MTEREIMSRRAAVGLLRAYASRAEEGSQLQRDLIIASDTLSDADMEIEGLVEERKILRNALERMDFSSKSE
jgi:hypothetical protein